MVAARTPTPDSLEMRRRLTGAKYTELSRLTNIPYKRLWRFFKDDGPLTRNEMARLDAALEELAPVVSGVSDSAEPTPSGLAGQGGLRKEKVADEGAA